MRVAALDLGSNTSLMLIAEVENQKVKKVILDASRITRLGQGVHESRCFHAEALVRMEECFKEYRQQMDFHKVDKVVAVATSAARDVSNRDEFLALGQRFGIPIQVIEGAQEAELTYWGAISDLPDKGPRAVIDVGGGSTEIIGQVEGVVRGCSIDVGSVRLTELFVSEHPISDIELSKMHHYVEQELYKNRDALPVGAIQEVVAVAGTPTTLAAMESGQVYDEGLVHCSELSVKRIYAWRDRLAKMSVSERQKLAGMEPKRADVIVAGSSILAAVATALGVKTLRVSTRGVRYGAAMYYESLVGGYSLKWPAGHV